MKKTERVASATGSQPATRDKSISPINTVTDKAAELEQCVFHVREGRVPAVQPFWGTPLACPIRDFTLGSDGHWDRWGVAQEADGEIVAQVDTTNGVYVHRYATFDDMLAARSADGRGLFPRSILSGAARDLGIINFPFSYRLLFDDAQLEVATALRCVELYCYVVDGSIKPPKRQTEREYFARISNRELALVWDMLIDIDDCFGHDTSWGAHHILYDEIERRWPRGI